ncbi:OmpA family protein [Chitinophaga sp. MM2321]|uniref:OmpA family protein n=1 Tax=Chitinophaga sp. MM2321 TaxID=3137178 RepID=UPI0032D56AE0
MNKSILWQATCLLMAALPLTGNAQDLPAATPASSNVQLFNGPKDFKTWSIGVNGGVLAPVAPTGGSNDFSKWKGSAGYGGYVKYQILHFLALRADYVGGKLQADNSKALGNGSMPVSPYESYETKLKWSGTLNAVFNITTVNWLFRKNFVLLYGSVGGGLAGYSPTLTPTGGGSTFDYKADGKSIKELIIPVGAGLKFRLSEFINLDLGYTMYYTDGDNLDGYPKPPNKDKYSYGYAGLEFALGTKGKPQLQWHNPAAATYDELEAQKKALNTALDAANQNNARLAADVDKLTKDSDGDGVSDFFDKCPGTPDSAKVDGSGCPLPVPVVQKEEKVVITEEDTRIVKEAIQNLEFDFAKSSIKPHSYAALDRVADLLKRKNLNLKLSGHTDNVGSKERNLALSRERAESVKQYLVEKGVNASKIEAVGYGMTQPIASNKTAAGRQKNRRVEFTIF